MHQIENKWLSISFDQETGQLLSLYSKSAGREFLSASAPAAGNPFCIWQSFKQPYQFIDYHTAPDPAELAERCLSPKTVSGSVSAAMDGDSLTLTYPLANALTATIKISVDGFSSRWSFSLQNMGHEDQAVLPVFPYINGIQLDDEQGRMLAMNQSGYIDSLWGYAGGPYGNGAYTSAQFGCLFQDDHCLGFYLEDASFLAKDIRYVKPGVQVRYFPPKILKPGETLSLPDAVILLYAGNWRQTAVAYGEWFRRTLHPDPTPDWIYGIDAYSGAWAEKKGNPNQESGTLSTGMDTFADLYERYLEFPLEIFEYAFYCEQSSRDANDADGKPLGPQPRRHTDGWNAVRSDLGGAASLRQGVEKLHQMGRKITLYIEGLIVPTDSELFEHIPSATQWIIHNPDGSNTGPYTRSGWYHMCPGSAAWQDHVADMAARLVRETDVDGIRLDSYSFYFWPCYNPAHHHDSPFDHNLWMQQMFAKVAAAVKAVKPDALLSTECPVDYNCLHFNHSLHQSFDPLKNRRQLTDTAPLRVALPDYRVCQWNGGALAQILRLMPDGTGRLPGTDFDRLARNWQNIRPSVAMTLYRGDSSCPNPRGSQTDMMCRLMRGCDEDLVFGVRPALRPDDEDNLRSGQVLLLEDRERSDIQVSLDYLPAEAWLYDLDLQTLQTLDYQADGQELRFATTASWFMVLIRKTPGPAPVILTGPEQVEAGQNLTLEITAPSLTKPVQAAVEINGLDGFAAVPVQAPGALTVPIPGNTHQGQYIFRLSGAGLRPVVKIVTITRK